MRRLLINEENLGRLLKDLVYIDLPYVQIGYARFEEDHHWFLVDLTKHQQKMLIKKIPPQAIEEKYESR